MKHLKTRISTFLLLTILLLTACSKDEIQGRISLEGVWSVNEVQSLYANFYIEDWGVRGIDESQKIIESGALGLFTFSGNQVTYNFTRNDTLFSGSGPWELELAKVQSGFFKESQWTLTVADDFVFDIRFEDGTKNSEKKANSVKFDNWPTISGYGVAFFMKLEKQ